MRVRRTKFAKIFPKFQPTVWSMNAEISLLSNKEFGKRKFSTTLERLIVALVKLTWEDLDAPSQGLTL